MKKVFLLYILTIVLVSVCNAQENDTNFNFKITGYVDTYFATDNDNSNTVNENRKQLAAINVKKNEFDINMAQVTINGTSNTFRFNMTLHYGSLSRYVYPAGQLANIQEGYAGVKLAEGLWLDGGLFLTHIGSESVTPKDNWLSTHSVMTNFEPFYQEGLRLSYDFNSTLSGQLWLINGYGIFEDNNENKTIGYYLNNKFSDDFWMSLAGTAGNEQPWDAPAVLRIHNNFITFFKFSDEFSTKLSVDMCNENSQSMIGGSLSARYNLVNDLSISSRIEFFDDKNAMLTKFVNPNDSLQTNFGLQSGIGYSLGLEYKPNTNSYIRFESRYLQFDKDKNLIFLDKDNTATNSRIEMLMNFGIFF